MTSTAPDVPTYIQEAPAERREALETLRSLYLRAFLLHTEGIEYGMPVYTLDGKTGGAFSSQKQYIALYGLTQEVADHYRTLLKASAGKGCLRFKKPDHMDFKVIAERLRMSARSKARAC